MKCFARHIFRLASLCVVVLTMVGALSSCRRYAGDEAAVGSALAVADSLRYDAPAATDSIIRSLDADSLGSRANAALYSVLANEVNIYGDQVAVADSLADIAVDYYCLRRWLSKRNCYLYARAMIQKADVSVDNKDYKKAIEIISDVQNEIKGKHYYDLIATSDLLLARILSLENEDHAQFIILLKSAVENFRLAGLKYKQAEALNTLGAAYRTVNNDSALIYLNKSKALSEELHDERMLVKIQTNIVGLYYLNHQYEQSITEGKKMLATSKHDDSDIKELYYVICNSYIKTANIDSARNYLQKANFDTLQPKQQLMYYEILRYISRSEGDYKSAYYYSGKSARTAISLVETTGASSLQLMEEKYRSTKLESENNLLTIYIIGGVLLVIIGIYLWYAQYKKKQEEAIALFGYIERLNHDILAMNAEQDLNKIELSELKDKLRNYEKTIEKENENAYDDEKLSKMEMLLKQYFGLIHTNSEIYKYVVLHSSKNEKVVNKLNKELQKRNIDDSFWSILLYVANQRYGKIIDLLKSQYSDLTEEDLQLIAMIIVGYSNTMISYSFGLTGENSLYNKQNKLKNKLGIAISLRKYLADLIVQHSTNL